MDPSVTKNKLIELLGEGAALLSKYKVDGWAEQLLGYKKKIESFDNREDLHDFLEQKEKELYGGGGSLLELSISAKSGHTADNFDAANQEVSSYITKLVTTWEDAKYYFE